MAESNVVVEKSLRSVFVGNIPYEATEEKLRKIFSSAGQVVSFKLMHDRESGKPKGYGFCEFKDQETALSAMRNLNGHEIGGRPLRVDNACTEKSRMEMQSLMMGPVVESPYGPEVEPSQAPEAISNAVASLPPEQMFELMRQMQVCVRSNRAEARTMLLNNPQLAYGLLQAQVVMRIIDPKTAVQLLHGQTAPPPVRTKQEPHSNGVDEHPPHHAPPHQGPPHHGPPHQGPPHQGPPHHGPPHHQGGPSNAFGGPPPMHNQGPPPHHGPPPPHRQPPFLGGPDEDMRGEFPPRDPRFPPRPDMDPQRDPRFRDGGPPFDPRHVEAPPVDRDFREPPRDPRARHMEEPRGVPPPHGPTPHAPPAPQGGSLPANLSQSLAGHDQEKAQLIMQVLQLSDEQIRLLPPEQQASIVQLKEQLQHQNQH